MRAHVSPRRALCSRTETKLTFFYLERVERFCFYNYRQINNSHAPNSPVLDFSVFPALSQLVLGPEKVLN